MEPESHFTCLCRFHSIPWAFNNHPSPGLVEIHDWTASHTHVESLIQTSRQVFSATFTNVKSSSLWNWHTPLVHFHLQKSNTPRTSVSWLIYSLYKNFLQVWHWPFLFSKCAPLWEIGLPWVAHFTLDVDFNTYQLSWDAKESNILLRKPTRLGIAALQQFYSRQTVQISMYWVRKMSWQTSELGVGSKSCNLSASLSLRN